LLIKIDNIRRDLLQKLVAENGIKKETKTMAEFLSDRSIIPDELSILPFPFFLRDKICKLAKFFQTEADIPSEKNAGHFNIMWTCKYSTLDKGTIKVANVHMKPDGTKYMTCDRYKGWTNCWNSVKSPWR
jgi:hypothetical protein